MSALPADPPPSPLDPVRILAVLPESERDDFLAAYRQALAAAADPAGFSAPLRLLRLWSMRAVVVNEPWYAKAPLEGGMFLDDLQRLRG
jgi:hypothetical protein